MKKKSVASLDVWRTESSAYSIDQFYTRSKDQQGHSTVLHVKIPDDIAGALASIVQSGKVPAYQTTHDILRDGLIHRLHWLRENIDALDTEYMRSVLARTVVEQTTTRYQEELAALAALPEQVESCCAAALKAGDVDRLREYINEQRDSVEQIREPFRSRITAILDQYEARLQ